MWRLALRTLNADRACMVIFPRILLCLSLLFTSTTCLSLTSTKKWGITTAGLTALTGVSFAAMMESGSYKHNKNRSDIARAERKLALLSDRLLAGELVAVELATVEAELAALHQAGPLGWLGLKKWSKKKGSFKVLMGVSMGLFALSIMCGGMTARAYCNRQEENLYNWPRQVKKQKEAEEQARKRKEAAGLRAVRKIAKAKNGGRPRRGSGETAESMTVGTRTPQGESRRLDRSPAGEIRTVRDLTDTTLPVVLESD